jgi:hypothetical protein
MIGGLLKKLKILNIYSNILTRIVPQTAFPNTLSKILLHRFFLYQKNFKFFVPAKKH